MTLDDDDVEEVFQDIELKKESAQRDATGSQRDLEPQRDHESHGEWEKKND